MQAVKEKISKVKAEAKAEEKAEKELAKARVDIAHEVRLAREAEGAMEMHVAKAAEKAAREITKHAPNQSPHPNHPGSTATAATMGIGNPTNNTTGAPPRSNYV